MEGETSKALLAALKMLARRDHFKKEIAEKLLKKEYPPDVIERVLERCTDMGYLNDTALADRFAELRAPSRGWGPARIRAELSRRGVDETISITASQVPEAVYDQGRWRQPYEGPKFAHEMVGGGLERGAR